MLNIGECVIYGSHGLCQVREILVPSFLERGKEKQYYMMISAVDAGSVLYVPVEGAEDKIREVTGADNAEDLIEDIEEVDEILLPEGKKAEPAMLEIIKRNDVEEMMGLVKSLRKIKATREAQGKRFATLNERYLNLAEKLLYTELAYSLETEKETIKRRVLEMLSELPLETA
ncbi:transcriptional regulator CarD family [Butyrivibrio proteoclasticus B316]|uniref:Transcriptional regulator CarD family n=1 Tax=Butyrivibrio proteoclasticus (strain ATCC 51982 / DSM 14932 / B316) TaxID=515622 RepID=E0RWP4_BUTPB|nr:CarD family transcriptional regulator [Butyrivibrio proteoclasticus]ADL34570.1 transcriptional regulator CarD family [Butyrivibrio proteoclasticus B316]